MAPTATWAEGISDRASIARSLRRHPRAALVGLALGVSVLVASCSSSPANSRIPGSASSTTDPTSATKNAVLSAWRAAETAFYQAEADPNGSSSPALAATMTGQELELVKSNLATQESEGFIGQGSWDLGSPQVVSLGPTQGAPTTATVTSCVHDTQVLVNRETGQPAPGPNGTPEWAGQTSTMVLSGGAWKLSNQSGVGNTNRQTACAGIG